MKISVIVPAYNAEETIGRCLSALLRQTTDGEKYEIIVVNDGSIDHTADIVKDMEVRCIFQENRGPASARNRGVEEAKGETILFTDADCEPEDGWIEEMVKPFDREDVVAVKGAYKTRQKELVARLCQAEFEERYQLLSRKEGIDFVDSYAAAFRKRDFLEAGGFDPSFPYADHEDVDLSYRMASRGYRMVFRPEAIVYHRHPATWKKYFSLKMGRGYWRTVVYRRFPRKAWKDSYTPQSLKMQILLVYLCLLLLLASFIWKGSLYLLLGGIVALLTTMLPFSIRTARKDTLAGVASPLFLALRALAIGMGMIRALLTSSSRNIAGR